MTPLLDIRGLSVRAGRHRLVHGVSFTVEHGEAVVLIGESGSGKTTLCRSITRLDARMQIEGEVRLDGVTLTAADPEQLRNVRRYNIRHVFQDPQQALNPLATVRAQMRLAADNLDESRLEGMLESVGIPDPARVLELHAHELSIGMAQRVMIAMALLPSPDLLIADEPTSALDIVLRFELLDMVGLLCRERQMAMLLVTHDIDVARRYGSRILVMVDGCIVEDAPREVFLAAPRHPHTAALIAAHKKLRSMHG